MLPPKADPREVPWPHAPIHRLSAKGTYFVTACTYQKEHFFRGANRVQVLHRELLTVAQEFGWTLEAWSVFLNHYHFVAHSPESDDNAESLSQMLGLLHEKTAKWINKLDICKGSSGLAQLLGPAANLRKILSDTTELCASESGEARPGGSG